MKKILLKLNSIKIYFLTIVIFFLYQPILHGRTKKPPLIPYMDQVIKRKKSIINNKCLKHIKENEKGFLMIEIKISDKGKTKARLVATELENKEFLICTLSILNRTQFKKIKKGDVTRIYRFFVL